MLKQCPCFESDPSGSQDTDDGTERHRKLAEALKSDSIADIDGEDGDAITWARDYIKGNAPITQYPLVIEQKLTLVDEDLNELMSGTPDQVCGNYIFDLKWRPRDYSAQMAAYALMVMQDGGFDKVFVRVLFGANRSVVEIVFDYESAHKIVSGIVKLANHPGKEPKLCDYCSWCSKILTCPAVAGKIEGLEKGYSDSPRAQSWHPSEMETGEQIADALWIAKKVVKPWLESIEFHAKEAMIKKGLSLPGFELKPRAGKKYITDVAEAYKLLGLPQEKFLECCDVRLNSSKKYPDKKALDKAIKESRGITISAAKKESIRLLAPVLKQANPSTVLKMTGDTEEGEE